MPIVGAGTPSDSRPSYFTLALRYNAGPRQRKLLPMNRTLIAVVMLFSYCSAVLAMDYEREKRWSDQILPAILIGEPVWLKQKNGHEFLALYTEAEKPRGAIIVGHGRGWNPDFELYGSLRVKLAEAGYTTLSIQLPVLGPGAKVGDYLPTYADGAERYELAAKFLREKGYRNVAIVSHSLGATMANQYLIKADETTVKAWVFVGIINGLEEMFRIKIPVLDVFGSKDWEITQVGAYERKRQIDKVPGSQQVVVPDALHFFEGKEDELVKVIVSFLDQVFHSGKPGEVEK
jgi:pimeloyl-ACP methyl ester carboxylesterase